jgi:hypothetical protein
MIGHFTMLLGQCAAVLPYIAEYEDGRGPDAVWDACTNSFATDFRALHGFMFRPNSRDADRTDFVSPTDWEPSETAATERLKKLANFIDKHRAHLSRKRFKKGRGSICSWVPDEHLDSGRLKAVGYARILTDYLDVLDEFILELPTKSKEQWLFAGASGVARNGVNSFMGLPPAKSLMLDVFGDEPVEGPPF